MPHAKTLAHGIVLLGVGLGFPGVAHGAPPTPDDLQFFETRIRPVLIESCQGCHGEMKQKAGLRVDHLESLLAGGESGPALVPGDAEKSRLMKAIRYDDIHLQMPPKGKLPDVALADIQHWIEIGAPWTKEAQGATGSSVPKKDAPVDIEKRKSEHWCWQPIRAAQPPAIAGDSWSRDALDRFVLDRLKQAGLSPAAEADRRTLIRRAYFDLIGLPPEPEAIDAFVTDPSANAFEKVVDSLLASPRFGERWARHWMDLFRYAETYGHEFDYPTYEAWRYRDYLIKALNADVPYDQMLKEHLAGDLLDPPRRDPDDETNQSLLATAHFFFPQATHAPVDPRQDEADRVDNEIDVISKAFLGLTVGCARCHDHKFDAISTRDYYALAGFMKSSHQQTAFLDPHRTIEKKVSELKALREKREKLFEEIVGKDPVATYRTAKAYRDASAVVPAPDGASESLEAHLDWAKSPHDGNLSMQPMGGYGTRKWSNDDQLWWTGAHPGSQLELTIEIPRAGDFRVEAALTKARDYGIVQFYVDGQPAGAEIDLFALDVDATGFVPLGVHRFGRAGKHTLVAEIKGCNPTAVKAYMVGIDSVRLTSMLDPAQWSTQVATVASNFGVDATRLERFARTASLDLDDDPESGDRRTVKSSTRIFEAFTEGFENWRESGFAFGGAPAAGRLGFGEHRQRILASCAHSGVDSKKLEGALRSKSFTIDSDWILYRLKGEGSRVRVIVDSYELDVFNALLFDGMTFDVNVGDSWQWHAQRVAKYKGHRAHIEILDEGAGWIAVDSIEFANSPDLVDAPQGSRANSSPGHRGNPVTADACRTELLRDGRFLLSDPRIDAIDAEYAAIEASIPAPQHALAIEDGFGEDEYVFLRGKWMNPGPDQPRRFLEALAGGDAVQPKMGENGSGRLELANRWLAESNPLPARVAVNRVWHHLFGRGIVPTCDDFGKLGEAPSHPELLDHLASWFRTDGRWSQKALIKRLVMSATYRMASDSTDANAERIDPQNRLLHRASVRRLEGEALRDGMLAIAGSLDTTMYGPSVPIALTDFMDGRGRPGASGPLDGGGRRSVYIEVRRNFLSPFMLAFDTPLPSTCVGRRSISNVPAQGLILMNDPFVIEMAKRFAQRVKAKCEASAGDVLATIYLDALGRAPADDEKRLAAEFLAAQQKDYGAVDPDHAQDRALADLCQVLFNGKEFYFLR